MKRYWIVGSVVLNVILVGVLVATSLRPRSHIGPAQDFVVALQSLGESHGLSDALVGDLVITAIRAELNTPTPFEYWRSPAMRSMEAEVAAAALDEKIRNALTARFGEQAANMPAFARAFQPFADLHPTLSPTKQVALQRLLQKQHERALQAARNGDANGQFSANVEAEQAIGSLLTRDELFEYRIRGSDFSRRLAGGRFEFTEAEFRAVYRLYFDTSADGRKMRSAGMPSAPPQDLTEQIASTLGPARFKLYERGRDPIFAMLSRDAARFGVSEPAVETAYDLIKQSEREVALVNADRSTSAAAKRDSAARIYESRNRELKKHLGPTLYARAERALKAPTVSFSADQAQVGQSLRR
jgi:hypothetical protein